MKHFFTLLFAALCSPLHSQFVNQLQYKFTLTPHEVDSVLVAQGIPSGIFPITYGAKVYKVIYNTVSWDSTPTIASGLMVVPVGVRCKVPVISYQHGTTVRKSDAMSNLSGEWFIGLAGAAKGNIVVLPDYLGLGDGPGLHPYQHAHTEATAVIDMIRAAKEVSDTMGAAANDQLFLFGYSQGGHATMAAHQLIQEQLDSVMHVTASAPMSGAYDMSGAMVDVMLSDSTYPAPYYLPYLFLGYNQVYNFYTNLSDVVLSPYDTLLPPLFDGTHGGGDVDAVMPQVPKLIMKQVQIDSFENDSQHFFRLALRENDTYNWVPNSRVRMYYCSGDHHVTYQNAVAAYNHFVQAGAGALVDTINVGGFEHQACAQFAILNAVLWFDSLAYHPMQTNVSMVHSSAILTPDGSAAAHITGGEAPFTVLWSNGDTTLTTSNLLFGTYTVTITDHSGCEQIDTATVGIISAIEDMLLSNIKVYPNPSNGQITIENLNPEDPITETELFDMNGKQITTLVDTRGSSVDLRTSSAAQGVYYLRLKSASGKEARKKVVVM